MRDSVRFLINGVQHEVGSRAAFQTLADYLRYQQGATGTKIVCAEGDCGACTVLFARGGPFVPVNSCIQSLIQLDGASIVTVEGLAPAEETTGAAVQRAMVTCHGAQCGYCTPGFVVAMTALFEEQDHATDGDLRAGLTGNLCRCTGYEPILKAGCSVDAHELRRMRDAYPAAAEVSDAVRIDAEGRRFFAPTTLDDAIAFKASNDCTIVQGGTDVGVWINKRAFTAPAMLFLGHIHELDSMREEDGAVVVGANVTLSAFESFIRTRIPELARILAIFGSPQIKNAGTLAGNVANGSPIADTLPYLFVAGASIELAGSNGRRTVPIDRFYLGYKRFDLARDEIITRIRVPMIADVTSGARRTILRLFKVSRRRDLDISAFTAAIRVEVDGTRITEAALAFGGVAPVVMRMPKTEAALRGHEVSIETFRAAAAIASDEVTPISDVRGSREYRLQLAANILPKFFHEVFAPPPERRPLVSGAAR